MISRLAKLPLVTMGSILVLAFFVIGTVGAFLLYDGNYTPEHNWISDLGDPGKNPAGYLWFNTWCILVGLALILVVSGLMDYVDPLTGRYPGGPVARVTGLIAGIAIMGVGLFPENFGLLHVVSAGVFFCLLGIFVLLVSFDRKCPLKFGNEIRMYSMGVGVLDLLFIMTVVFGMKEAFLEWMAVISGLVWIGFLGYIAVTAHGNLTPIH